MPDIVLRGGTVVDGSGQPAFTADVALRAGRITEVGTAISTSADLTLDCRGLVVAPGFIDAHSHSDLALLEDPTARPKVAQGVTTEIVGNCGWGPFPALTEVAKESLGSLLPSDRSGSPPPLFDSVEQYGSAVERARPAVNVAALVAHGAIRLSVLGAEDRAAEDEELATMQQLGARSLRGGAVGVSFGLLYAPGAFTPTDEMVALASVLPSPALLVFHVRNECDRFEESIREAIAIGERADTRVHVSHLKVADPSRWGSVNRALTLIEAANRRGRRVTCDQYPYTAGSGPLQTLLPPWALAGRADHMLARLRAPDSRARILRALAGEEPLAGWDNLSHRIGWGRIAVGWAPAAEAYEGRTIEEIAGDAGRAPAEVLLDLLTTTRGAAVGVYHQMCEEDVQEVMAHPSQMVGSDGLPLPGKPHPRLWGTFPRVLGRYVRDLSVLSLEQAIHKMTARTAQTFGLDRRGLVRPGYWADISVFDADAVTDRATYEEPTRPPEGIVHVICNGLPTMLFGDRTQQRPGRWLR